VKASSMAVKNPPVARNLGKASTTMAVIGIVISLVVVIIVLSFSLA